MPNRTARKVGIEMEGYMRTNPRRVEIPGARLKHDASLANGSWSDSSTRNGVEVVSNPIRDLDIIGRIFQGMESHGWSVDQRAGTHVHIDIADYSEFDKVKLLRFCKGIERIIYMFVKSYREGNRYAQKLQSDWRKVFKPISRKRKYKKRDGTSGYREEKTDRIDWNRLMAQRDSGSQQRNILYALQSAGLQGCNNSKYFWLNIYGSRHGTAEFRIFHAVENGQEAMNFARLAHNIVDLVKHASVEQLEFIIMSLYESANVYALRDNFFQVLVLPEQFSLPFKNLEAKRYVADKLAEQASKREERIRLRIQRDQIKLKRESLVV